MATAAATTDIQRQEAVGFSDQALAVKAGQKVFAGTLVCIDANGFAYNGDDTAGRKCAGVARTGYDNTDGADGVIGTFNARAITVQHGRAWLFACDGSPKPGLPVYMVNNNSVTTVAGNVFAGVLVQLDGPTSLWEVYIPGVAAQRGIGATLIAALTDNTAGTANTTLQAMPDPTDTPADADALRDDLVANLLPAIRNNFADLTAAINALRGA